MKNIFTPEVSNEMIARVEALTPSSQPKWGKMNVAQMLAHCNVTYTLAYDETIPKPNIFLKLVLKLLVKKYVVGEKPFRKNSGTAPIFIIKDEKKFNDEKKQLIENIQKTQSLGEAYFDGKESHSFGKLSAIEWNNMFYKHLDHHLSQFGV